jgi:hypothetical protein
MIDDIEDLETDFERAEYLQSMLVSRGTGGDGNEMHYQQLRSYFLDTPSTKSLVPRFVKTNRTLDQFWEFIKNKDGTYAGRRKIIWSSFEELLSFLESKQSLPAEKTISEQLEKFDSAGINFAWNIALGRKSSDPEGAITISRTILESICKHILDAEGVEYNKTSIELSDLYKATANKLNLAPEQHTEQVFKQILGGCSGIVNGLGSLRNKLGDAHGKSKAPVKPQARHAELAVNLAGTMALFLIQTYENNKT